MLELILLISFFSVLTVGFGWKHYCDLKEEEAKYY